VHSAREAPPHALLGPGRATNALRTRSLEGSRRVRLGSTAARCAPAARDAGKAGFAMAVGALGGVGGNGLVAEQPAEQSSVALLTGLRCGGRADGLCCRSARRDADGLLWLGLATDRPGREDTQRHLRRMTQRPTACGRFPLPVSLGVCGAE